MQQWGLGRAKGPPWPHPHADLKANLTGAVVLVWSRGLVVACMFCG